MQAAEEDSITARLLLREANSVRFNRQPRLPPPIFNRFQVHQHRPLLIVQRINSLQECNRVTSRAEFGFRNELREPIHRNSLDFHRCHRRHRFQAFSRQEISAHTRQQQRNGNCPQKRIANVFQHFVLRMQRLQNYKRVILVDYLNSASHSREKHPVLRAKCASLGARNWD